MEYGNNQPSLSADLNLIYKTMPSELLNEEGYHRLSAVTGMLPAALTGFWGLECRLHQQAPLADILFEVKRDTPGHEILAGQDASGLDELCRLYPVWQKIRDFASQWLRDDTLLHDHILNLWLEFDTEKTCSREAVNELVGQPSVFLGFRSADLPVDALRGLLNGSVPLLQKNNDTAEDIVSFIKSIPLPGQLFQLGSMLGRPCRDTRVCVNKLRACIIPGWLNEMGWQGDNKLLKEILDTLAPLVRAFAVDLNLTRSGISEQAGIECYLEWDEYNPGLWADFLDILERYAYIHPLKRSGLLRYPGRIPVPSSRRKDAFGALNFLLFKMIHHIKLSFDKSGISGVKAYLAVHRPGIRPDNNWLVD